MIGILDYGMGNLRSVQKALDTLDIPNMISSDPGTLAQADKYILPGVGAFGDGMKNLEERGLISFLHQQIIIDQKPLLGICLGMQLLAKTSTEMGEHSGLGWIDAKVIRFGFETADLKVPHVGWNNVTYSKSSPLFTDIADSSDFYFVHSYHMSSDNKSCVLATTDYGYPFISAVQQDNIYGCQFHPEKSQKAGLKLLQNFATISRR